MKSQEISPAAQAAKALVEAARASEVLDAQEGRVLVRVSAPRNGRFAAYIITYTRNGNATWDLSSAVRAEQGRFLGTDGSIMYAATAGKDTVISRVEPDGNISSQPPVPGRLVKLLVDERNDTLWVLAREVQGSGSGPVLFTGTSASVGAVRRQEGVLRLYRGTCEGLGPMTPTDLPGFTLTGEASLFGSNIALTHCVDGADGTRSFGLLAVDPEGTPRELRVPNFDLSNPVGRPEDKALLCTATNRPQDEKQIPFQKIMVVDADLKPRDLPRVEDLADKPVAWLSEESFISVAERAERRVAVIRNIDGTSHVVETHGASIESVAATHDVIASLESAPDRPPEIVYGTHDTWRDLSTSEVIHIDAPDIDCGISEYVPIPDDSSSAPLGAWLFQPHDKPKGLIVNFHGGPLKSWTDWTWRWNPAPFVAAGYAVALVNPPMSLGYGDKWIRQGWRDWYAGIGDVAARQVAFMQAKTGIRSDDTILMGGSFGGYLALAVAERIPVAKVIAHAAPTDLLGVAEVSDVDWQWRREYGDPMKAPDLYRSQNLNPARINPRTAIFMSHGLQDDLVPIGESMRYFRGLTRSGHAPKLMVLRDEGHPILFPTNLTAWYTEVFSFLDTRESTCNP